MSAVLRAPDLPCPRAHIIFLLGTFFPFKGWFPWAMCVSRLSPVAKTLTSVHSLGSSHSNFRPTHALVIPSLTLNFANLSLASNPSLPLSLPHVENEKVVLSP